MFPLRRLMGCAGSLLAVVIVAGDAFAQQPPLRTTLPPITVTRRNRPRILSRCQSA